MSKSSPLFLFGFLLCFFFAPELSAAVTLEDPKATVQDDDAYRESTVYVGDSAGSSESSGIQVYIPLDTDEDDSENAGVNTFTGSREKFTVLGMKKDDPDTRVLPSIDGAAGAAPTFPDNPRINFYASHNNVADRNICFAFKNSDGDYVLVGTRDVEIGPNTGFQIQILLEKIYNLDNNKLNVDSDADQFEGSITAFLFAVDADVLDCTANGTTIDLTNSSFSEGIYLKLKFSAKVESTRPTIDSVKTGDQYLTVPYNGVSSTNITKDYLTTLGLALRPVGPLSPANILQVLEFRASNGGSYLDYFANGTSGEVKLGPLDNGEEYEVGVALISKYYFASPVSVTQTGTPLEIEAFLKKQSCYLISAGFQEEHEVIEFFKLVRDHFLRQWDWGNQFISWYYSTAPAFAPYIYQSKILSFMVRIMSYGLYGLMKYFFWWITILGFVSGLFVFRKRIFSKA